MCALHDYRQRHNGDPLKVKRPASRDTKVCTFPGCSNPHDSFGLCRGHRMRQMKHGDPSFDWVALATIDRTQPCKIDGCDRPIGKRGNNGMCRKHARQAQRARRPDHYLAKVNARRALQRRATPPWVDMETIEQIYRDCPAGEEVDHIVPLQGEGVCGLHVPWNLRHLPTIDNRKKGNRLTGS